MTSAEVARAVRTAINGQTTVRVSASVQGEMIGSSLASAGSLVHLHGPAGITRTGIGLPVGSPLTLVTFGADQAGFEDSGDRNRGRVDQGQLIVSSSSFSFSSQNGIRLDDSSNPTAPRALPTPNTTRASGTGCCVDEQHSQRQPSSGYLDQR